MFLPCLVNGKLLNSSSNTILSKIQSAVTLYYNYSVSTLCFFIQCVLRVQTECKRIRGNRRDASERE